MSTLLEGQMVAWRSSERKQHAIRPLTLLRNSVIILAIAASAFYLLTASQTVAVASGLVREAFEPRAGAPTLTTPETAASPVVVTLRPSARNASPLRP